MPTFYLDYENGNDASDGSTFATAGLPAVGPWKTITSGATAARIAPGDIIRIAKSPDPVGKGFATWTNLSKTVTITALTLCACTDNGGGEILVTKAAHNLTTGDIVTVSGTTDYNGTYAITVLSSSTFKFTKAYVSDQSGTVTPAFTAVVDLCETAWTAAAGSDVTVARTAVATDGKEGSYCMKFTTDAATQANILQAYYPLAAALDLSLYQKLSFWFKNEAAIADATTWEIALCSDAAGAVVVDSFAIPAIPSTIKWLPLTIARTGGGNLGNNINSIALYSKATAPTASKYIYTDDFIACTTNGLNLQSLISKNSLAQGGTEGWYGIQSINGNTVLLDNDTNTKAGAGRGYSTLGTSPETVALYKRETIKTALAASSITTVQSIQDSGTSGNNIQFQGGYDTSLNTQIGETFFDGLNGSGYAIKIDTKSYTTINHISTCRYAYGFYHNVASNNTLVTANVINCQGNGVHYATSYNNTVSVDHANNNGYGIYIDTNSFNIIVTASEINNNISGGCTLATGNNKVTTTNANNNTGSGFYISSNNNIVTALNVKNNSTRGIQFASCTDNIVRSLSTSGNGTDSISNNLGKNYIFNATFAEATIISGPTAYAGSSLFVQKVGGSVNDNRIFSDGAQVAASGLIFSQTVTRHVASGLAWEFQPDSTRTSVYPASLSIAKIACQANKLVTFKAWMKKDHATNIACGIRLQGYQIAGVDSDVTATAADSTDWQQLTINFTPTEAGVVEILAEAWYVAGNSNAYVHDISVDDGYGIQRDNLSSTFNGQPLAEFYPTDISRLSIAGRRYQER